MANNTFGEEVNDQMLDRMPRYAGHHKTQEDRAREAMRLINDQGKNAAADNFVRGLKNNYGNGVSALCVVYNGTGDPINLVANHNWHGHIGAVSYPSQIKNGQWGAFLHVHPSGAAVGCTAAVVYRGHNKDGIDRDSLIAWDVPWGSAPNKGYCEVGFVDTFPSHWDGIESSLGNSSKNVLITVDQCRISVSMEGGTSPFFRAELSTPFGP